MVVGGATGMPAFSEKLLEASPISNRADPAGCKMYLLLAKAEPISNGDSTSE